MARFEAEKPLAGPLVSTAMRIAPPPRLLVAVLALAAFGAALVGCGKTPGQRASAGVGSASNGSVGAELAATKNTTRLGGGDPASDAAAVARAVYPGLTAATRPQVVVLVNQREVPVTEAAAVLASTVLGAPILYADGDTLPEASAAALRALHPSGAPALGGAQVIRIGTSAGLPKALRSRTLARTGDPSSMALAVEQLLAFVRGGAPRQVIALPEDAPPALTMPAAGLSAQSGAPIVFVNAAGVPPATEALLRSVGRPAIFLLGSSAISSTVQTALARFGAVTPIAEAGAASASEDPVANAIAVARFTDGTFGWGVKEPGHGLVFASAARPLDAAASAPLAASGDYGPLLLLGGPAGLPSALVQYLADIQPAYGDTPQFRPVHGAYNHGWLIGDQSAISALAQAEIDSNLEIAPPKQAGGESSAAPPE